MRTIWITLTILCLVYSVLGQNVIELSKNADQDSLKEAMEERFRVYRIQQEVYRRMLEENPKRAMDSVVAAQKAERLPSGQKQLEAYAANSRIDTLKEINLSYAGLTEIPEFVFRAKSVEILLLDYNDIKRLPKELADLPNLKKIYWRSNVLDDVWWIRMPKITGLEKLDLSGNTLTRLPIGVKKLDGLKELVLEDNLFGEVPVGRLSKAGFIKTVSLGKNQQLKLDKANYGKLDFVEVLKVNSCRLTELHPSVFEMKGLTELQLQENQLDSLPTGISSLTNLNKLSFYKNALTTLPADLFELPNLLVVDLYYNQLEVIPESIGNLRKLEVFFLAHNRIYSLPESIGQLSNLEELYLHHNRLSALPASLDQLAKLRVARVNDNYLTEFPAQLLELTELEDVDIANNQITTVPKELELLNGLNLFTYHENPIDFANRDNEHLAPMIIRMLDKGVTCVPRVYEEEVVYEAETQE